MKAKTLILEKYKKSSFTSLHQFFIDHPIYIVELTELISENNSYPLPEYASWLLVHIAKKKEGAYLSLSTRINRSTNNLQQSKCVAKLNFCQFLFREIKLSRRRIIRPTFAIYPIGRK